MLNMRLYSGTAWLIAMLLSSACGSDENRNETSQYDLLDVDYLWQGSVPVEYDLSENIADNCQREGETELLIPYVVSSNGPLQVELYGCWQGESLVTCKDGLFKMADVNTEDANKVIISLLKEEYKLDCLASEPRFQKWHTIDVNGTWQPGELEVIVRNSDGDLTGYVTVE